MREEKRIALLVRLGPNRDPHCLFPASGRSLPGREGQAGGPWIWQRCSPGHVPSTALGVATGAGAELLPLHPGLSWTRWEDEAKGIFK